MPFQRQTTSIRIYPRRARRHKLIATLVAGALTLSLGSLAVPANAATATASSSAKTVPTKTVPTKTVPAKSTPAKRTPAQNAATENAAKSASLHAPTQLDAAARARTSGKPVIVDSETTETRQVTANADGTFTMASNAQPVRVQRGSGWVPIDPTLKKNADGSFSPNAATDTVAFSGGGSAPLAVVADPKTSKSVSVSWPGTLPAPTVHGASATYAGVLPGVDLRVTATSTGYSEVLIVHDAAAAHNPKLASLAFGVHGNGVNLKSRADGTVAATDPRTGTMLFSSQPAQMWDSTVDPHRGPAPSADAAGSGQISPLTVSLAGQNTSSTTLTVTPPASALTGAKVRYPLYIDPQLGGTPPEAFAEAANFPKTWWNSTDLGSGISELGYCGYSSCVYHYNGRTETSAIFRDFFQMDTTPLTEGNGTQAQVYAATFYADETYNSVHNCVAEPVALYESGPISPSTAWGSLPEGPWLDTQSSAAGGGSACPAGDVVFGSANPQDGNAVNVTNYAQAAASANPRWSNLTFELRAADEGDTYQFKNFADNPVLYVTYNYPPNAPTGLTVGDAVTCTGGVYTADASPTLYTSATDNNPAPLDLNLYFELWNVNGTTKLDSNSQGITIGSGSQGSFTTVLHIANNTPLSARALSTNIVPPDGSEARQSPWSNSIFFTVLDQTPATPTVSSFDYPANQWGQAQGTPGVITVSGNGASNLAGFAYSIDGGAASEPVPSTADCGYLADGGLGTSTTANNVTAGELASAWDGTAQIQIPTGLSVGPHTMYVKSFDFAHNASAETAYRFYVAPNYQTPTQQPTRIEAENLPATGSGAANVAEQTNCCNVSWSNGAQALFSNSAAGGTFTLTFSVPYTGYWDLGVNETTAPDFGAVRYDLDGTTNLAGSATMPFDGYTAIVSEHLIDLGTPLLTQGSHTLTFTVVSKNPTSSNYRAGIDYISLAPTNRYEAETLTTTAPSAGTLTTQPWPHPNQFSGNNQLLFENTAAGSHYTVSFNAPVESDYALGVNLVTATDYGTLRFDLDPSSSNVNLDNTATTPIDAYSASVNTEYVFLGGVHLTAGTHVLKVTVVGANAASVNNRYNAGIDYIEAAPVTGAKSGSFTASMNNHGIGSDGTSSGADFDLAGGDSLSRQALQAAGITPGTPSGPGSTFMLGGATFTMPQLNADGDDNVIADGQTIPLPAVKATDVALLATATCLYSPASTATLHYTSGQPSQAAIPLTGDWLGGPTNTAAIVMPYRDGPGGVVQSGIRASLYELLLPANPGLTLSSISLPLLSPSFLTGTACQNTGALHILAIGTRGVAAGPSGSTWVGAYAGPIDSAIIPPNPTTPGNPPGNLSDWTLRTQVPLSVPGSGQMRVRLSNTHATSPVTFDAATIGAAATSGVAATVATPVPLTFCLANGQALGCTGTAATGIALPAGGDAYSDPTALPTGFTGSVTVSLHIASSSTVTNTPVHESLAEATFFTNTDPAGTNQDGTAYTTGSALALPDVYYVTGIDVNDTTAGDGTVAVLGDQASASGNQGWEYYLPTALQAQNVPLPGGLASTSTQGPEPTPAGHWLLGERGGNTAYDSSAGGAHNAALTTVTTNGAANPTFSTDSPDGQSSIGSLEFDAVGNGYAATSGSVLDTTKSFTVSAWARLNSTGPDSDTIASQDGTEGSGFYLQYSADSQKWVFMMLGSDTANPTAVQASANVPVQTGVWTHLVGEYNQAAGAIYIYVNGRLAGSAAVGGISPWNATGPFVIGRAKRNGAPVDNFDGEIADVRAFASDLSPTDVDRVYADNGTGPITTAQAIGAFENNTYVEPNLRDVIISLGSADVMQGLPEQQIEANLNGLITWIKNRQIPNQSDTPVNVDITTIQPLGLPSGDPRETVRDDVNNWILRDTSATLAVDTTSAGGDPNKTATAIATALANSINGPVPGPGL